MDNYENISKKIKKKKFYIPKFELSTKIITGKKIIKDFIQTFDKNYILVLFEEKNILVYSSKDFSIFKEIKLNEKYESINEVGDGKYILGGVYIGIFYINDSSYHILHNDNIPEFKAAYLTGTVNEINYSNFVLTYFNKLICRKVHVKIIKCHYDDVDDEINIKKSICIFDFNPEKNSIH